jgi:hypothetical protein
MTDRDNTSANGPIPGPVVAQYFGFFNGVDKQTFAQIVAAAPFDKCNLLILAFVHAVQQKGAYVAQFTNWRDNKGKVVPGDTDVDRVKLIVQTARKKNPSLNILISLGWGTNDAGNAAKTPIPFADSVRAIVQTYGLNGIDIDFESTDVQPQDMLVLAQQLRISLNKATPKRKIVMTITPAQENGLNKAVLQAFDYTMPQSYNNYPDYVSWFQKQLGSFAQIVYGLDSEGPIGDSNDPKIYAAAAKKNHAAGIFAWRLDNDSLNSKGFPTFATGIEMWKLMNQADKAKPALAS